LVADPHDGSLAMVPQLETRYVFTITARIGEVTTAGEIGHGVRRIIPIIGGEVSGENVNAGLRCGLPDYPA
jgi:hypothetical protein